MNQNKIWGAAPLNVGSIVISSIHQWLAKAVEHKAIPILFAYDTSILITGPNNIQFQSDINIVFGQLSKWFKANLLFLNFNKTSIIQFANISTCISDIPITYEDKKIHTTLETKFLGYLLIIIFLGKHTLKILSLN